MSIALDSAKANHNLWGDEYLHYYLGHAPEAISWAQQIASLTKSQNMVGVRSNMRARVNDARKGLQQNSNLTNRQIENFLEGKYLKGLGEVSEATLIEQKNAGLNSFQEAIQIINDIDTKTSSLQDFSDAVEKALNTAYEDKNVQQTYKEYAQKIVYDYADSTGLKADSTELSNKILADILTKYDHEFFKMQASNLGINTTIAKVLAIIKAIPNVQIDGAIEVRHGTQKSGTMVSGQDNILEELKGKVVQYFQYAQKITLEYALAQGLNAANHVILNKLINGGGKISRMGDKNLQTNFHIDENMKREYELTKLNMNKTQQKRSKSDVGVYAQVDSEGNGVITGSAGITVKDYKGVSFVKESNGIFSAAGEITLQSGTPLLTALMREANISYEGRRKLIQYLVGHDNGNYNYLWEDIKGNLANRMFLNALAGLRGVDNTLFICLNGKIFSLSNFIDSFISSPNSEAKIAEYLGQSGEKTPQRGLERETYQNMNIWVGQNENSLFWAKMRSTSLERRVYQTLANTKLHISLNLAKLGGLVQLNK